MKYCDECGGIVVPKKENESSLFVCRSCGKQYEKEEDEDLVLKEEKEESNGINVAEDEEVALPETEKECDECGNDTAYWWTAQTRGADEPETRFFKCTECGNTWREYD